MGFELQRNGGGFKMKKEQNSDKQQNPALRVGGVVGTGGICRITNDKFSWVLEVDGKTIPFNGGDNADYFAELYAKLGYEIIWDKDKWKEECPCKLERCPTCGYTLLAAVTD